MKIDVPTRTEGPLPTVLEMLVRQDFHEEKCRRAHAEDYSVTVKDEDGATAIRVRRLMPADGLPEILRSFVKDGVTVEEHIDWAPVRADGSRVAQVSVRFLGQPLGMKATLEVRADGTQTAGRVQGELKAKVPLVGGKIERAAAPQIIAAIDVEQDILSEWLAAEG